VGGAADHRDYGLRKSGRRLALCHVELDPLFARGYLGQPRGEERERREQQPDHSHRQRQRLSVRRLNR
jgi:hypothetical protein